MKYTISTPVTDDNTILLNSIARWLPGGQARVVAATDDEPAKYVLRENTTTRGRVMNEPIDVRDSLVRQELLKDVRPMCKVTNIEALLATAKPYDNIRTFLSHPNLLLRYSSTGNYIVVTNDAVRTQVTLSNTYLEVIPNENLLQYQNKIVFLVGEEGYANPETYVNSVRDFAHNSSGYGKLQVPEYIKQNNDGYYYRPVVTDTYNFSNYLAEQIRVRYAFFDRPKTGLSNIIMDSFFPRLMFKYHGNKEEIQKESVDFPSTAVAISPFVAEYLNVKKVATEQLCRVLGYSTTDLKKLLTAVKNKKINFIFVGAGGTGINTAYWLSELMKLTNTYKVFSKVGAFEGDSVEYSNMLRFPLDSSAYNVSPYSLNKLQLLTPLIKNLGTRKPDLHTNYLKASHSVYSDMLHTFPEYKVRANTVLYGAPGIEYRDELASIGPLICATHANTSCSIWLNPKQNEDIQIETYGIIQLGSFFMNQLQMTISLLELLASDQDLSESDKLVMDFEFDGTLQLRTDRNYHWQMNHDNLVMTTAEANNF